jgi:hypothetical protein
MKIADVVFCIILIGTFCQFPAVAQKRSDKNLSSHCGFRRTAKLKQPLIPAETQISSLSLPPMMGEALQESRRWAASVEKKIRTSSNLTEIQEMLNKQLAENQMITCEFTVDELGKLSTIKEFSSGGQKISSSIAVLVKESAPFEKPPNRLPMREGMSMTFFRGPKNGVWLFTEPHFSNVTYGDLQSLANFLWTTKQMAHRRSR